MRSLPLVDRLADAVGGLATRAGHAVEEPLRQVGAALHARLPADGLEGLDPDTARAVAAAGSLDTTRVPVPLLRVGYRLQSTLWNRPRARGVAVADEHVTSHVTIRTYTPREPTAGGLVYFHGGGMMIGSLATHDRWCRWIAARAGVVVHSVSYRLVPEHPFPAGCLDAIRGWNHVVAGWQATGGPTGRLGVGGDSAGGYLAALVATQAVAPTLGVPVAARPDFAWLVYPGVDASDRAEAHASFLTGVPLTGPIVERFSREWTGPDADPADPARSPGLVDDAVLAAMPPVHLVTCAFDPLTAECLRFRDRLQALGVPVTHQHHDELAHDFIMLTGVSPAAEAAAEEAIDHLRAMA